MEEMKRIIINQLSDDLVLLSEDHARLHVESSHSVRPILC